MPRGAPQIPPLRYAPVGMTMLLGNAEYSFQDELSSRPERTRISCHAAVDESTCAPFGLPKCFVGYLCWLQPDLDGSEMCQSPRGFLIPDLELCRVAR